MLKYTNFLNTTKEVSSIEPEDETEFYKILFDTSGVDYCAFENNFAYIMQSCRPFFKKYKYKESIVYFTFHEVEAESRLIITNAIGKQRYEAVARLAQKAMQHDVHTLLKNIDIRESKKFEKNGFKISNLFWNKFAKWDDNTFPQYNIQGEKLLKLEINRGYRRQIRNFEKTRKLITEPFDTSNTEDAMLTLQNNALFLSEKGVDEADSVIEAHKFFFLNTLRNKVILQHREGDKIIGYSYLTVIPGKECAFYNALFNLKESDLMKYILYCGMKYIFENFKDVKEIGIQGSENEGQNFMKVRFKPTRIINKIHMIN